MLNFLFSLLIGYWLVTGIIFVLFHPIRTVKTILSGIGFLLIIFFLIGLL